MIQSGECTGLSHSYIGFSIASPMDDLSIVPEALNWGGFLMLLQRNIVVTDGRFESGNSNKEMALTVGIPNSNTYSKYQFSTAARYWHCDYHRPVSIFNVGIVSEFLT